VGIENQKNPKPYKKKLLSSDDVRHEKISGVKIVPTRATFEY